eukprot:TRINITY_DN32696_c0_g1_i1.p1 TRINITY_DN32696_c0_g1~~TRINITY_DN32696_c0_g1_i1.p1  ORF type:complete len:886 (+),score=161.90 TRINITY_DN32696_c0_g1_i1:51-2708(+)
MQVAHTVLRQRPATLLPSCVLLLLWPLSTAQPSASSVPPGLQPPRSFRKRHPHLHSPPDYNLPPDGTTWQSLSHVLGDITDVTRRGQRIDITCGPDQLRVQFYRQDIVRVWLGWDGSFSDEASADLVLRPPEDGLKVELREAGDHFSIRAAGVGGATLRAYKAPLRLELRGGDGTVLFSEMQGLTLNSTATFQTLKSQDDEFYFGGGMQNGRFSHKGHRIRVSVDYNWEDGGNPNAAPFYVSTAGYAVFRNTWSQGFYDFSQSPAVLAHNETRFDAFYFAAAPRDFKKLLEGYTFITGRPFMPPIYGLALGDADCYHNARHEYNTNVVVAMADAYRSHDFPAAWILPNDGYGCGFGTGEEQFPRDFTVLDEVVGNLSKRNFTTGLWSSTGLPNIKRLVEGSGTRIAKTDVAWIGPGYKFAFDAVKAVSDGIESNSDARRFIWTVEGWAGTQRLAVMWTGDHYGTFDAIRWQIPTFVGSGFSAQAHVSGDIDGIFGGSPETYVRDLQFKCFMTVLMTMSGWARNPDKQPWTWGEPYTSINRMYLKLKLRLTPYFYTLSRLAHDTGLPPVRAMALEFPGDNTTFSNHTGSSQQFMSGPFFLVAPVYRPLAETDVRDGIYLPSGPWVDYWKGGVTDGPLTLNGHAAPLDQLPIFIKGGAIIPMWPDMAYVGEVPADPLTLDVYPSGSSSFELYEDDGVTREALEGNASVRTLLRCKAPDAAMTSGGNVSVFVSSAVGHYDAMLRERAYTVLVHLPGAPGSVVLQVDGGERVDLAKQGSLTSLDYASSGWVFTPSFHGGLVKVKTPRMSTAVSFQLELLAEPPQRRPPGSVSCGAHWAGSCPECPQGNGQAWCNGQCTWQHGACKEAGAETGGQRRLRQARSPEAMRFV